MKFKIGQLILLAWLIKLQIPLGWTKAQNLPNHSPAAATKLTKLLNNITYIHADFTQLVMNKNRVVMQEQAGVVQLKKPNLLNWQVLTPDRWLIVIDGKKIWNYDLDLEQIIVKDLKVNGYENKLADLLLGELSKSIEYFKIIELKKNCQADLCFLITRKENLTDPEAIEAFTQIELGFNQQGQLIMLQVYDQLDQITLFNFSKFKNSLDPKAFEFIVPPGVDLMRGDN